MKQLSLLPSAMGSNVSSTESKLCRVRVFFNTGGGGGGLGGV
jgi:hypothetical protein